MFMSNLNIIMNKVEELTEIREKVNKVKKNSGPGLLGDILDTQYVKDLLMDLSERAKTKVQEFSEFKCEKEQEMEKDFLEVEDQNALDAIISGHKEAEALVKDIEELLSPNRQVTQEDVGSEAPQSDNVAVEVPDVEGAQVAEVPAPRPSRKSASTSTVREREHPYSKEGGIRAKKPQCPRDAIKCYHDILF